MKLQCCRSAPASQKDQKMQLELWTVEYFLPIFCNIVFLCVNSDLNIIPNFFSLISRLNKAEKRRQTFSHQFKKSKSPVIRGTLLLFRTRKDGEDIFFLMKRRNEHRLTRRGDLQVDGRNMFHLIRRRGEGEGIGGEEESQEAWGSFLNYHILVKVSFPYQSRLIHCENWHLRRKMGKIVGFSSCFWEKTVISG